MKRKWMSCLLAAVIAVSLALPVGAASEAPEPVEAATEEVIYARLSASGVPEAAYAVVALDTDTAGTAIHHGEYTEVKNLTSAAPITYADGTVTLEVPEGRSYYQGTLETTELPWLVEIRYTLDGAEIGPEDLGGQSGDLEIHIRTLENPKADAVFYDNYLLQVTVTLDAALCREVRSEGGTVANAGGSKSVTFTVLPGGEGDMSVSAQVENFRMDSISLAAVPYDVSGTLGDTSELTSGLTQVTDAIGALSDGAAQLSQGAAALESGAGSYGAGLRQLSGGSQEIVTGSEQISQALKALSGALSGQSPAGGSLDLTALAQLPAGLRQIAAGLGEVSGGMSALQEGYAAAYDVLAQAISAIPAPAVTEADIAALMAQAPENPALAALVENYQAAQTVRGTWEQVRTALEGVKSGLPALTASLETITASLESTAQQIETAMAASGGSVDLSGLAQLAAGLQALEENYAQFHAGLTAYTGGVDTLQANWGQLSSGITSLAQGSRELSQGAGELNEETQEIPAQIEEMLGGDQEEFQPQSFLDGHNGNTRSVQFVLTTEAIEPPSPPEETTPVTEEPGFFQTLWNKLTALFQ